MKPSEHVIKLRGLPYSATVNDVIHFLSGVRFFNGKAGVHFTELRSGHPSGQCFVELASPKDVELACKRHKQNVGDRYIEVFKANQDWLKSVNLTKKKNNIHPSVGVVRLRGLPFDCPLEDIKQFFDGLELIPDGINKLSDYTGRSSGEAFVQFVDQETAERALEKDREKIGHRYIEVFLSSADEAYAHMAECLDRSGRSNSRPSPYERPGGDRFGGLQNFNSSKNFGGPRNFDGSQNFGGPQNFGGLQNFSGLNNFSDYRVGQGFGGKSTPAWNRNGSSGSGGQWLGDSGGDSPWRSGCGKGDSWMRCSGDDGSYMGGSGIGGSWMEGSRGGGSWMGDSERSSPWMGGSGRDDSWIGGIRGGGLGIVGSKNGGGRARGNYPVVHMQGLPFNATLSDISHFFDPVRPLNITIEYNDKNRPTGEADVIFECDDDALCAMERDRCNMYNRYIELFLDLSGSSNQGGPGARRGGGKHNLNKRK